MTNKIMAGRYNSKRTRGYDSKTESKRAWELGILQRAGKIHNLEQQVPIVLQDACVYRGEKIRKIEYIADFVYEQDGELVVEDTKSKATADDEYYKLKVKMLKFRYPNLRFFENIIEMQN